MTGTNTESVTQSIIREVYAAIGAILSPKVRVRLDEGAYLPERAHGTDAGADIRTPIDVTVPARGSVVVDSGVHIQLPPHTCGLLVSKSGLMILNALTSTGLIDQGFTGEIRVRVFNYGDEPYEFAAGEKVSQVVVLPVTYPEFEQVDEIAGGERGDAGYGSTGR